MHKVGPPGTQSASEAVSEGAAEQTEAGGTEEAEGEEEEGEGGRRSGGSRSRSALVSCVFSFHLFLLTAWRQFTFALIS